MGTSIFLFYNLLARNIVVIIIKKIIKTFILKIIMLL